MRAVRTWLKPAALLVVLSGVFGGCQTEEGSGPSGEGGAYYATGFYDPWYGGPPLPPEVIVPPPPGPPPPRPEHPIAKPPPSIPMTPRPMPVMRR
jgi:hypothetical protein